MKKLSTILFATLFAASSGAFAAAHMKGDKDMTKDEKSAAKGDKKGDAKKGEGKKADADAKKSDKAAK